MKILVAVDGSVHALDAVKHLIEHVNWYRDPPTVVLMFVHPPLPRPPYMALDANQLQSYYQQEGDAALAKAKEMLDLAGIAYTADIRVGPIAESIVKHARVAGCDLILMSTRGIGAGGNLLLGSTATKVLYFSATPVLIVNSMVSF